MSIHDFIEEINPLVLKHGWRKGLSEYSRNQTSMNCYDQLMGHYTFSSSRQSIWKLFLPEYFEHDLFVADSSLGAVSLDLSKSYGRVITWSVYDNATDIIRARVKEAGVSNIFVYDHMNADELAERGFKIRTSVFVLPENVIESAGIKLTVEKIENIIGELEKVSCSEWTNIFIYPKKFSVRFPFKAREIRNRNGIRSIILKRLVNKYGLKIACFHNCKYSPEKIEEIEIRRPWRVDRLPRPLNQSDQFMSNIKKLIKTQSITYPSKIMAFSKCQNPPLWIESFISYLDLQHLSNTKIFVQRYRAGNPNMILLELQSESGEKFICRMPLGIAGSNLSRVRNNYSTLFTLQESKRLRGIVPKPVNNGMHKGQDYYIETFLHGHPISLTKNNYARIYHMVRPILLALYNELGKEILIDKEVFESLLGNSIAGIREHVRGSDDWEKTHVLEKFLKKRFLSQSVKLPFVHGDFKCENILFNTDTVSGIFDWDLAADVGFPFIDLAYFYGYSFYHSTQNENYGVIDFIISQLLRGEYSKDFEYCFEDYRTNLRLSNDWKFLTGILFWLHYLTKITAISTRYDLHPYNKFIKTPLEIISENINSQ